MRVLLVSTYELGHQPVHVASPAAALRAAGHDVVALDTSVERFDRARIGWADAVGFSVPMHTAMRLALPLARQVKEARPDLPVCFYGLYAPVSRDLTVGRLADRVITGEYERALVAWVAGLDEGDDPAGARDAPTVHLDRGAYSVPARELLPGLERYAHLSLDGELRPVGAVETTHGCKLTCRHCPVPAVYGGRFRAIDLDTVLTDVAQLVAAGARHVTFADPDFLNAPTHARRIVTALHERWPDLTFDCTTKVDHIVDHPEVWPTFADAGCLFVVSAFETTNDAILARLRKGHTTAQASAAVRLLRDHGIEVRPSWLPFTPWTTLEDLVDLVGFVAEHDLIGNTEPVMYTIRLLVPEGSLLLDDPDVVGRLDRYDPQRLTWTWRSPDPRVDTLQERLAALVEARVAAGASHLEVFLEVAAAVQEAAGVAPQAIPAGSTEGRPRLTEPWFC